MERLTPLAATFLEAEDVDPHASLAIGSLAIFEGPAPSFDEFVSSIEGRLPLIPRYRQRLQRVPFDLAAPVWVDDPHFDLRWHVRNTALPAPGGRAEIGRLMSRVMSQRMNRRRPLWEYWFCEGLEDGRWALLSKLHHSLVDGVSGTELYNLLLDPSRTPRPPVPDTWEPSPTTSTLALTSQAAWELVTSPVPATKALVAALTTPLRLAHRSAETARGLLTMTGALRPVQSSSLTGYLGGSRRYTWTDVELSDIKTIRRRYGVTLNDVALAVVTGGFRTLLMSRGEEPDARAVRTLVPVSTREPGAESIPDNRVSLMLPYLPVDLADPLDRLTAVSHRVRVLRDQHEPEAGGSLTTAAQYSPFAPVSWGIRLGLRMPQRSIATVTTNVPGPRQTLYALGRELEVALPYVPIADRVRIGVAMFSYGGTLTFGITCDYDSSPDVEVLAEGIDASMTELLEAASGSASVVG